MNAVERYARWEEVHPGESDEDLQWFALRADGKIVLFDEDGFIVLGWTKVTPDESTMVEIATGAPAEEEICIWDEAGTRSPIYCEPMWLAAFYDHFYEMNKEQNT